MNTHSKNGDIAHVVESYFTVLSFTFKGKVLQKQVFKGIDVADVEKQFRKKYPKRGHVDITPM
jgi:hypothetical protein